MHFKYIIAPAALLVAAALMGCGAPVDSVSISGSTTILPVVAQAADMYSAETGRQVIVNAGGSGSGFNQLASGQTDIAMMSRDVTYDEYRTYSDIKFEAISIGRDAVVPVVSREIYDAGVTALRLKEIADIYAGRLTNWSDLGGPDRDILVIDKEAGSGTRQVFFEVVAGDGNMQAPGTDLVIGSNNEGQTAVTQSDSAIAQLSHAWLNDDVKGLMIIGENSAAIAPTLEYIRSGDFPITRDLTLVVREDRPASTQDFIDYLLSPAGQKIVADAGYVAVVE